MKTLRKLIPFMLLTASACATTGCSMYTSKADKLENIVGFYELEIWKAKREKADEEPYDRKADEGTVAYFTIDKDGYSYYGFKDKDTEPWVKPAFSRFEPDTEKEGLFKAVIMQGKNADVGAGKKRVGCMDEPTMGFKRQEVKIGDGLFKKKEMVSTLAYTIPWSEWTILHQHTVQKYQYVQYKRISGDTGYQVINQKLGTHFQMTVPYEIYGLSGKWVYRCQPKDGSGLDSRGLYEYAILDMDSCSNGKLNLIYSTKEDPGKQTTQVPVAALEKGRSYTISAFGQHFNGTGIGCTTDQSTYPADSDVYDESFTSYWSSDLSIDEIIDLEREPSYGPYIVHNIVTGQKKYNEMQYNDETRVYTLEGLELGANEEFAINTRGSNDWRYFEDLNTASSSDKIVEGSKAGTRWGLEEEYDVHYLKASEAGKYDVTVAANGSVTVVKQ